VTESIAGIEPFANLGTEERNKRAEAPVGEALPFVIEHADREMRFLLTECGLEAARSVLADAISAVEVERADAACDAGGGGARC